jgi:hypothetical protein
MAATIQTVGFDVQNAISGTEFSCSFGCGELTCVIQGLS